MDRFKIIGHGVYGLGEASRLTGISSRTVRRWFSTSEQEREAVLNHDYPKFQNRTAISFLDLIDLRMVGALRDEGVSLQRIRRARSVLKDLLRTTHPFAHKGIFTDGQSFFIQVDNEFEELFSRQRAFKKVLKEYLREIDFDPRSDVAMRWRIAEGIVVDPEISYGKPSVESVGVPTSLLAACYIANRENAELVGDLYSLTPQEVLQAVRFERSRAA